MKGLSFIITVVILECLAVLGALPLFGTYISLSLWDYSQVAMAAYLAIAAAVTALVTSRESWLIRVTSIVIVIGLLVLTIETIQAFT